MNTPLDTIPLFARAGMDAELDELKASLAAPLES